MWLETGNIVQLYLQFPTLQNKSLLCHLNILVTVKTSGIR